MSRKWFGWTGTILKVDLTGGTIQKAALTEDLAYQYLGQAGINARILYDLAGPGTDPFSPDAPQIFGAGPLAGTLAPCSGRFSVTFKSPLTGFFGDSNCGGHWGSELKMAGYDHIGRCLAKKMVPLTKKTLHDPPAIIRTTRLCDNFSQRELTGIGPNQTVRGSLPSKIAEGNRKVFSTFLRFFRKLRFEGQGQREKEMALPPCFFRIPRTSSLEAKLNGV